MTQLIKYDAALSQECGAENGTGRYCALPYSPFPWPEQPSPLTRLLDRLPRYIRVAGYPGPVMLNAIEPTLGGGFVATDGEPNAITFPARSGGPDTRLIDLVAVMPDREPMTLRGNAVLLGHHNFDEADIHGDRLYLHRDPVSWLASGGEGVAVLDWFVAAPLIARLPELLLDNVGHADMVWQRLRPYGKPKIYLMKEQAA